MNSKYQVPGVKFFFKAALVGGFSATLLPQDYAYLTPDTLGIRVQMALIEFATYFALALLLWLAFEDYLHVKNWIFAGLIGSLLYALSVGWLLGVISPEPSEPMIIFERLFTGAISAIPVGIALRSQFPRWYLWVVVSSIGCLFLQFFNNVLIWSYQFRIIARLFFDSFFVGHLVSATVWGIARILFSLMLGIVLYWMIKTKASGSRYVSVDGGSEFGRGEMGFRRQVPVAKFFFRAALVGLFSANLLVYYSAGLSGYKIPIRCVILNFATYFALVLLLWLAFEDYLHVKNWIFAGLIGGLLYALSIGWLLDVFSDKPSDLMIIFERLFTGAISAIPVGIVLRSQFPRWYLWIAVSSIGCFLTKIFSGPFLGVPYLINLDYRRLAIDTSMGIVRILFSLILCIGLYWIIKTEALKEPLRKSFAPLKLDS